MFNNHVSFVQLKKIFKNDSNEIRSGWQIGLFVAILGGTVAATSTPLIFMEMKSTFALTAATLVGTLAATYIATRFLNRKPITAVGLAINKHTMRELGLGCLLGWLMLTGIFGTEYLLEYVKVSASEVSFIDGLQAFCLSIIFFAVAAMVEELLFRGYPFQTLIRGINLVPAAVLVGLLFGLAHLRNPNATALGFTNTVLVALLFAFAYWRTRGLWLPFGIHFAWNFGQTTLYGFPTSGLHFSAYELTRLTQFGPEWLTGGLYGPEGGALSTVAIVLCGVYIYYSKTLRPFPGAITLEGSAENVGANLLERGVGG